MFWKIVYSILATVEQSFEYAKSGFKKKRLKKPRLPFLAAWNLNEDDFVKE